FQAEDGIRDRNVTGVQTCALPIFDTSIRGTETNPFIIFFRNEGSKIALYPIRELARDVNENKPPAISNGFSGITLAYNAKSVEEIGRASCRERVWSRAEDDAMEEK